MAGTIDTIAGGGGLLTLPALLFVGLPSDLALGTNKLQATFGSLTAARYFIHHGRIPFRDYRLGLAISFMGSLLGSLAVLTIQPQALAKVIPILLLLVLMYSLLAPKFGELDHVARVKPNLFWVTAGFAIGFYDGFLGPGTGAFWAIALVYFMGFNLQKATMHTKIYNGFSNLAALIWFLLNGKVVILIGLAMACGQFLGAKVGSYLVMQRGTRLIRPLFITMVSILLLSLGYKTYFG